APLTVSERAPRCRLFSSTSLRSTWKAPAARVTSTKSASCAIGKNGSYPRRAATAARMACSPGHCSAPGPRTYTRRADDEVDAAGGAGVSAWAPRATASAASSAAAMASRTLIGDRFDLRGVDLARKKDRPRRQVADGHEERPVDRHGHRLARRRRPDDGARG